MLSHLACLLKDVECIQMSPYALRKASNVSSCASDHFECFLFDVESFPKLPNGLRNTSKSCWWISHCFIAIYLMGYVWRLLAPNEFRIPSSPTYPPIPILCPQLQPLPPPLGPAFPEPRATSRVNLLISRRAEKSREEQKREKKSYYTKHPFNCKVKTDAYF